MDATPARHAEHVCERKGCGKRGDFQRCGRCKMVRYCGKECQSDDWKRHKTDCHLNNLPEMPMNMETILRSGAAAKIVERIPPVMDEAMYERGVTSGAYSDTHVDLGRGVKFGMCVDGFWLQFKGESERLMLGKLVGMDAIVSEVNAVMRERRLPIKGRDAYMKLMEATARVFRGSE